MQKIGLWPIFLARIQIGQINEKPGSAVSAKGEIQRRKSADLFPPIMRSKCAEKSFFSRVLSCAVEVAKK